MRLKGKVAVVTGSGTGIGQAIAAYFAAEGASVTVNCYERKAQETIEKLKNKNKNEIIKGRIINIASIAGIVGFKRAQLIVQCSCFSCL